MNLHFTSPSSPRARLLLRVSFVVGALLTALALLHSPASAQTAASRAVAAGSGVASDVVFGSVDVASSVLLAADRGATTSVVAHPADAIDAAAVAAAEAESAAWAEELLAQGAQAPGEGDAAAARDASASSGSLRSLSVLFLGAGLVVIAGFALLRYRKNTQPELGKYLKVVQTLRLDAKHQLAAVQVPSGILVLSLDEKETKLVTQLAARPLERSTSAGLDTDRASEAFAAVQREVLRQAMEAPAPQQAAGLIAAAAPASAAPARGGSFFEPPALPPVRKRNPVHTADALHRDPEAMEAERVQLRARAQRRAGTPAVNQELERVRRELEQLRVTAN
jgi:flagellar biogenesis protein FliO